MGVQADLTVGVAGQKFKWLILLITHSSFDFFHLHRGGQQFQ